MAVGSDDAHGCASAGVADGRSADGKISTRVLVLGGTVIALVLAETIYIGRTTAQIMPAAHASAHHKPVLDRTFTLMPTHARAPERNAQPPLRPVVGMIEGA